MTPKQVKIMAAYFEAERLADATEELIKAHEARRAGLLGNCSQFEALAEIRLKVYRKARADYEAL